MRFEQLIDRSNAIFANGAWRQGQGAHRLDVVDPSFEESFASIGTVSAGDVADAVEAASDAFSTWRARKSADRACYLRKFATGLAARRDDLIRLQMTNNGKPQVEADIDVGDAIATFEYYADLAQGLDDRQGEPVEHGGGQHRGKTRFEAIGPVGMIVP